MRVKGGSMNNKETMSLCAFMQIGVHYIVIDLCKRVSVWLCES